MKKKKKFNKKIKKYKKEVIIFFSLLLITFSGLFASYLISDNNCVIMITDSQACHCVKNRCISLKNQISDVLKINFNNSVRFKVIEYRNKKRSEKIMNKYNMGMIPAVVIINKKGEAIYNSNFYNFSIEEFKNKIYELKEKK
jgi:hypothetical protein